MMSVPSATADNQGVVSRGREPSGSSTPNATSASHRRSTALGDVPVAFAKALMVVGSTHRRKRPEKRPRWTSAACSEAVASPPPLADTITSAGDVMFDSSC